MMPWRFVAAVVAGGGATALGTALAVGARTWTRCTAMTLERLRSTAREDRRGFGAARSRYDPTQLSGLPPPAARYFKLALTPGQPFVRRARFAQQGTFASARDRWAPFEATEEFTVSPPGFVWDARIRMAPLVVAYVRDSYVGGAGEMHAAVGGLLTIVHQRGTPEMAAGSLLRYLAEAVWFPTALLPSAGVRWGPIDDLCARASLSDAGVTVSMDVRFAASGEIQHVSALRHRDVKGTPVLTPWSGRFGAYSRRDGMLVPGESEVGWELADGWFPYWRGRAVETQLELMP